MAIENDPLIPSNERQMYLTEAVQGCKVLYVKKGSAPFEYESEKTVLTHIRESHMLIKRSNGDDSDDEQMSEETKFKIEKFESDSEQ